MAKNGEGRITRILDIVSTFDPCSTASLQDLSAETGTPVEELRSDFLMLHDLDIGLGYIDIEVEGDKIRVGQLPPAFNETLLLDDMQMLALSLALKMTGLSADTALLDKLYQGSDGTWNRDFLEKHIYVYPFAHSTEVFKALAIGLRNSYPVQITYVKDRIESERLIDVARMSLEAEGWYVSGYCRKAKAQRIFRLDAITDAKIIYLERSKSSNNLDSHESAREALEQAAQEAETATIVFDSSSLFIKRDWPLASDIKAGEDGSITIQIPIVSSAWLARTIVGHCGKVRVTGPSWLAATVKDYARQCLSELPE